MIPDWICLIVNPTFYRRGRAILENELNKVFGEDLLELRVVFGEEHKDVEEYYAFVRCSDYDQHLSSVMSSPAIKAVLSTYENPVYLSDADVNEFMESIEEEASPVNLSVGDMVKVKDGYLSGLTGFVTDDIGHRRYKVLFRFHTRKFQEEMAIGSLTLVDSLFGKLKFPVVTDNLMDSGVLWASHTGIQFCGVG